MINKTLKKHDEFISKKKKYIYIYIIFLVVLGIELRVLLLLDRQPCSIPKADLLVEAVLEALMSAIEYRSFPMRVILQLT
jgi:hypothetical protein